MAWACKCDKPGECSVFKRQMVGRQYAICKGECDLSTTARAEYLRRWADAAGVAPPKVAGRASGKATGGGCCGGKGRTKGRLASLKVAVVDFWRDGLAIASDAVQRHREAVCEACPIRQGMLCAAPPEGCGCVLALKRKARAAACPQGKWFEHHDSYLPLVNPVRNLVMHVWPTRNGAWRWNLDQILRRIDLFNGKRVLGIVTDSTTETANAVKAHVAGHGFEFFEAANKKKLGEVVTFVPTMERVASTDPNGVTFRCHAKGSKHKPFGGEPQTVQRWAAAMYETLLDDWPAVADALESHTLAGSFKRYVGMGKIPYHYSGTFYWLRNHKVFSNPRWRQVAKTYAGVEMWPAVVASDSEAACLFSDYADAKTVGDAYLEKNWSAYISEELERWRAARR